MEDIAAQAELSKGTLYLYFKSKDDLFLALSAGKMCQVVERFREVTASGDPGLEQLRRMMQAYGDAVLQDRDMFRIAILWLNTPTQIDMDTESGQQHRGQVKDVIGLWVAAIQRGVEDGSIRPEVDPMQIACQIWAGMIGTLFIRVNSDELTRRAQMQAIDFDRLIPGFIEMACDGLRPLRG
jgi:AcrR family transcriptional regulator